MRIAICEDDKASRDYENLLIHKWAENNQIKITVDSYTSAENFLFESEDKLEYDFLLLDIQMGKMNGFELAKTLRSRGFSGSLAFLTGIIDYAVDGYEVGAVRYLLKPVKEESLFHILNSVYSEYEKQEDNFYILQIGSDISKIKYENIVYVEARGHYVHLCGKEINNSRNFEKEWKASFSNIVKDFNKQSFFCLRRGLLVNLEHVTKISKTECLLSNGETVPIPRNNYNELNKAFIHFYREKN